MLQVGHGDFVVEWPSRFDFADISSADDWRAAAVSHVQHEQAISNSSSSSAKVEPDDWTSDQLGSNSSSSNDGVLSKVVAELKDGAIVASSRTNQQRLQLLQELPHYCRDLAVVVMGQQQINFVQEGPVKATTTGAAGVSALQSMALGLSATAAVDGSSSDGSSSNAGVAEVAVQTAENN